MATAKGDPSGSKGDDVGDLLNRLNLDEEEDSGFVWEDEIKEPQATAKWLAIAKVHTTRGFSPSALFADMRSAWNPAKDVSWRRVEENLFTVQFACLGDWNKAMEQGPWFFRNQAVMMEEYDGFQNPRSIVLNKIIVWAQILKLPDNFLKEPVIRGMCREMGEIVEVQIRLPAGFIGEFVRVRAKIDVNKKLKRFVSMTKNKQKDWYQVKYEKLPTFCGNCGMIGHWHEECGDGVHDESKLQWGNFILADGGRGAGRGCAGGRSDPGRGGRSGPGQVPSMGRGRGRFGNVTGNMGWDNEVWNNSAKDGSAVNDMDIESRSMTGRKRLNFGEGQAEGNMLAITDGSKVSDMVGLFDAEKVDNGKENTSGTPGKVPIVKRTRTDKDPAKNDISATSEEEVDREQ
jgi:hypothetical protein